jgi:hypothetical protein
MFRKLTFKWLLIIFGILLVGVLLTQLLKNHGSERNFNSRPVVVDTAQISSIFITHKLNNEEIKITRKGANWIIESNGKSIRPDKQAIDAMLNELANIQADRIAATEKSEWAAYDVTDTAPVKVRIEQKGKTVADFIVGKFSYQQNPQKFTTFIRINGQDEVYSVQGFLSMSFGRNLSDLRDKTLVNVNPAAITRITFTYPADSSYILEKVNNSWKIGSATVDSAKLAGYINTLAHRNNFDILNKTSIQQKELYSIKIEGNNISPIYLKTFESDTTVKRLITSTMNPDVQFQGAKGELSKQIFVPKKSFFGKKKK